MICFKYCLILIGLLHYTRRIYGQLAINVPEVGNYGEETHLNCTEASFNITNGYTWLKDNNKIYDTVNGDATNTGKYTSTHGTGFFTLTVADTVSNDDGEYTCKYNFNQQSSTLNIQAKGTVTAELSSSSSGKLEVTFQKIYPSEILVVITCDSIQEAGNFVSNETDGDRFNRKWESNKNFTSVPSDCSVQVTLVTIFPVPFVVKSVVIPIIAAGLALWIIILIILLCCLLVLPFMIGIVLGLILLKTRCCCDSFYDDKSCKECVNNDCCRCECCAPTPCGGCCNIVELPNWYQGLCGSGVGILVAFGIWLVWKCFGQANGPGGLDQPENGQPLQGNPV